MKAVFCIAVLVFAMFVVPSGASAESSLQVLPTDKGTVKVGFSTIPEKPSPGNSAKLKIDFLNAQAGTIQEHIDYTVMVTKDGKTVFGPIPLTHTSLGTATIPVEFKEKGDYKIIVDVQGVLFQPIPSEKATFSLAVGQSNVSQPLAKPSTSKTSDTKTPSKASSSVEKAITKSDAKKMDKTAKTDTKTKTDIKSKADAKKDSKTKPDTKPKIAPKPTAPKT
jgi:hypothetical protein